MKIGDKVNVNDYSYGFGVYGGEFYSIGYLKFSGTLTVVKTGLSVMQRADGEKYGEYREVNDLLVIDGEGNFWFTQSRFCELVNKKIEIRYICDGEDITDSISDETKRNLR